MSNKTIKQLLAGLDSDEELNICLQNILNPADEDRELRDRIRRESDAFVGTPSTSWPLITMNWDIRPGSARFALDGFSQADYDKYYPKGLLAGQVALKEIDKILCHFSRRDEGELWEVGAQHKLAYLIIYLSEGRPITPPLIKPHSTYLDQVMITGGHHRYAIAKEVEEESLPIYVEPCDKAAMDKLLTINWLA